MPENIHERLNEIRIRQGREPIDGTRIEGFGGPGDPPAPDIPSAEALYGPALDLPPAAPPAEESPLVALGKGPEASEEPSRSPIDPRGGQTLRPPTEPKETRLWIEDTRAHLEGRRVVLLEEEVKDIRRVVIRALKRDLDTLQAGEPKVRRRRSRGPKPTSTATSTPSEPGSTSTPRSRRPRGSLLNRS